MKYVRRSGTQRPLQKRATIPAALATVVLTLGGCAVSDTASEQRIERERTQASEAAKQSEQIKQLQQQVESQRSGQPPRDPAQPRVREPAGGQQALSGRVPTSGTYTGYGAQRALNGGTVDKSYAIEMVFSRGGSTIRYPDLSCSGRLQPTGFDQGRRVYREHLTSGSCDNGGIWLITVDSDTRVSGTYRPPSGRYIVAADLTR